MKINFGKLKKRNIVIGNNKKMRPTQSVAKSIIFNVLEINKNTKVLDLFAGTGSLGLEAASLGASDVTWFDNDVASVKAIQKNIDQFELSSNFQVYKSDFRQAIKKVTKKVNLIFLDPPFIATKYYDEALDLILSNDILEDNGVIVLEKEDKIEINNLSNYKIKVNKKFGEKDILFLTKK